MNHDIRMKSVILSNKSLVFNDISSVAFILLYLLDDISTW